MTWKAGAIAALALLLGACASLAPENYQLAGRYGGPDGGWDFTRVDPVHRRLYVARTDGVTTLDLDSGQVVGKLVAGVRTHIALPINNGDEIFVTNGGDGSAFIADARTGAIRVKGIPTGSKPDGALLEPVTGLVWALDNAGGGITLVNPATGAVTGRIESPGALESGVFDAKGTVWITVEDLNEIVVVDARRHLVISRWPLRACDGPTGLAFEPASERLVAECANGKALVISARSGAVAGEVELGEHPDALAVDTKRGLVFAPTGDDGVVRVIDPARVRIVGRIQGRKGSRHLAVDPRTGALYMPAAMFDPPIGEGRPRMRPGTFEILKLAP